MEQFEIKMVSHQVERSTSIDPKIISRRFQMTTRVSQHMFGTLGIQESNRYADTINISISIHGNVSYGAFLHVQKGFPEDFMKNSVKMLKKLIKMKRRVDLSRPEKFF